MKGLSQLRNFIHYKKGFLTILLEVNNGKLCEVRIVQNNFTVCEYIEFNVSMCKYNQYWGYF